MNIALRCAAIGSRPIHECEKSDATSKARPLSPYSQQVAATWDRAVTWVGTPETPKGLACCRRPFRPFTARRSEVRIAKRLAGQSALLNHYTGRRVDEIGILIYCGSIGEPLSPPRLSPAPSRSFSHPHHPEIDVCNHRIELEH